MRSVLIISLFFIGFTVQGQNTGLYGKKWCIDISATGRLPLFNMLGPDMYKSNGSSLRLQKDVFDYGFRTGFSYAVENNFAVGMEVDLEFSNLAAPTELTLTYPTYDSWTQTTQIKHEALKVISTVIMPTLTFTSPSGLLPIGLSHQFGIGFLQSKVIKKDYKYILYPELNNYGELPITSTFPDDFYDYSKPSFKGIAFAYTLNVRTPINKFMMLTYGFRYNIYHLSPTVSTTNKGLYYYSGFQDLKKRLHRSIISLNLGMSFAL